MIEKGSAKSRGKRVINKGKKGFVRILFSRVGIFALLIIIQAILFVSLFLWFRTKASFYYLISLIFILIMSLWLFNSRIDPSAKITWLALIALFPLPGALLLFYTRRDQGHRILKAKLGILRELSSDLLVQDEETLRKLREADRGASMLANYIYYSGHYPVYHLEEAVYFPSGRDFLGSLLAELEKAEDFIFLEYFIIDKGEMWDSIRDILIKKAAAGLDVRVMYDGTCEFSLLEHDYPKKLRELGIKCRVFAPLTPFLSTYYNYRDHRKIAVIDGHTAFTGGINLADEYVGLRERYGIWKDSAVLIRGSAVRSFTLLFLRMWYSGDREMDFSRFLSAPGSAVPGKKGFVIPFGDDPIDDEKTGERIYMDILNRSCSYVHIMTPYLILDGEMETALKFAAERGSDVKIILPGIPDKKVPYALAKTHYASLLDSGVRIYEYVPGFVHAKVFVSDDREAVVGSINLDYRSLYHHFECAAYLYGAGCIADIEADFGATLAQCREVNPESVLRENPLMKLTGIVMKSVAPLM